jgi:hypothetical protein
MGLATPAGPGKSMIGLKPSRSSATSDLGRHRAFTGRGQDGGITDYVIDADTTSSAIILVAI